MFSGRVGLTYNFENGIAPGRADAFARRAPVPSRCMAPLTARACGYVSLLHLS